MQHSQHERDGNLWEEPWVWLLVILLILILAALIPALRPVVLYLVIVGAIGTVPIIPLFLRNRKKKDN